MMAAQKAILTERQASGGFISDEEEAKIRARRKEYMDEDNKYKKLQDTTKGDTLEAWKEARAKGDIKTASSGLERDKTRAVWAPRVCSRRGSTQRSLTST